MRVTAKVDYALRAMAQLAAESSRGPVSATRLAEQQAIPLKFLHGVLADLKRARLVRSTRGPDGGYELGRPAGEITLARFRDLLGTSRRPAQLLLERFDADGVTRRVGDARVLRRAARAG